MGISKQREWGRALLIAALMAAPGLATAQELTIEQILAQLYGTQNVERVPNSLDQVWLNNGGTARAVAKYTAFSGGTLGYYGADGAFHRVFEFGGDTIGFNVTGSGALPPASVLPQFRWVLDIGGSQWSTRPADNWEGSDHAITYRIKGGPSAGKFVVFWEDLPYASEGDVNDFVVEVSGVSLSTTPQPSFDFTVKPPEGLQFGYQALNTETTLSLWLRNKGSTSLPISSATLTGPNPAAFRIENRCGTSVAPGASCSLRATFRPGSVGVKSAQLRLVAGSDEIRLRNLTGNGVQSSFSVAPTSLSFGSLPVNTASEAVVVNLANNGSATLPIASISLGGMNPRQFSISHACPAELPVGGACKIGVVFHPTWRGSIAALLNIQPGGNLATRSVALAGAAQ